MDNLETLVENYLEYCSTQKCLDEKTLKAYRIDLRQFSEQTFPHEVTEITSNILEDYIAKLHQQYKPKTVKRKIASLKALFHYLEYKEIIYRNPFNKIQVRFREPVILPNIAAINLHIAPHMFRHTFTTCLLEADVDIRYIQQMLGHSSITVTEIYTHITLSKQKDILTTKHPRKDFKFQK